MNQKHTNEPNYTKLVMPRQQVHLCLSKGSAKRLDALPSKLAILKQDIWKELGLDPHCMKEDHIRNGQLKPAYNA